MTVVAPNGGQPRGIAPTSLGYGDYLRFSKLVRDRCGLHFPEKRLADLERGVRQAFAVSTCTDLSEYFTLLQDPDDGAVHFEQLVNALTVGETHFFRDAAQFDALYNHVLPQLIKRRRTLRTMRIWSAGCASGQEPYSIAIVLRQLLPDMDEWSITILGTDINTEALDRARKAVYSEWAFREERAKQWRPHYFRRQGNHYELIPEVRRMVTFARLNLAEDHYPAYETNTTLMDLILCRNVMIYFPEPVTRQIVERFHNALADGGWLVVGHAEHSLVTYRRFQVHNYPHTILYRRADQLSFMPRDWHWLAPPTADRATTRDCPYPPAPVPDGDVALPPVAAPAPVDARPTPPVKTERRIGPPEPEDSSDHVYIHTLQRLGHVDPFERAKELLSYGRSEEARDLLLGLVKARPHHAPTCALLGQACANLGRWQKAEDWCRQAVRLDSLALEAYYTLALVLQHQGQLDPAIATMKKVVYVDRHNVLGHFGLADLYRSSGQLPQALKSLDNAHRLLNGRAEDELIPGSGGITTGNLREAIIRQQQQWSAEASGP